MKVQHAGSNGNCIDELTWEGNCPQNIRLLNDSLRNEEKLTEQAKKYFFQICMKIGPIADKRVLKMGNKSKFF